MIYLACPYTHGNPKVEAVRANEASRAAAHFIKKGELVFSPLSHSASIEKAGGRNVATWEMWMTIGLEIMSICKRLVVLGLVGWAESKGVIGEISHAFEINVPVVFVRREALDTVISLSRAIAEELGPDARIPGIPMDNSLTGSRP